MSSINEKVKELIKENDEKYICPSCGVVTHYSCRLCGATRSTNQVSGNVIWMRNGRIVAAFADELQAWLRVAEIYKIDRELWPEPFRSVAPSKVDLFEE